MEDIVAHGGKFEPPDINKPPEPEVGEPPEDREAAARAQGEEPKKIKEAEHPVGEVEIQPPKVEVQNGDKDAEDEEGEDYTTDQLQFMMGVSLVVGFVFMLLVDQCGGGHSHAHVSGEGRQEGVRGREER